MNRFFAAKENIYEKNITIDGEDVQHITKVLRLEIGDTVVICDGNGTDYIARIEQTSKNRVETVIIESYSSKSEADIEVVLYQGLPKASKMETIIQKCTEMGIDRIVPITTVRTIVKLDSVKDEQKKIERWTKIAEEAAKQSGRGKIPTIDMPLTFEKAVEQAARLDLCIIPYEKEKDTPIYAVLKNKIAKKIGYFIGPEGGFDESEVQFAVKNGILPITLGPRILRTETAGMAVLTCIMYEYQQMK